MTLGIGFHGNQSAAMATKKIIHSAIIGYHREHCPSVTINNKVNSGGCVMMSDIVRYCFMASGNSGECVMTEGNSAECHDVR